MDGKVRKHAEIVGVFVPMPSTNFFQEFDQSPEELQNFLQCGAPVDEIDKLVNITPKTMVYCTYNYS